MVWPFGHRIARGIAVAALAGGCSSAPSSLSSASMTLDGPEMTTVLNGIQGSQIKQHMSVLADDALEGRGLGSPGYEQALQYVEKTVTSFGLAPAGENGGFRQRVPLRNSVVVESGSAMSVRGPAGTKRLVYGKDYLLSADPLRAEVRLEEAPVVFVGYGVSAPARRWGVSPGAGSADSPTRAGRAAHAAATPATSTPWPCGWGRSLA